MGIVRKNIGQCVPFTMKQKQHASTSVDYLSVKIYSGSGQNLIKVMYFYTFYENLG